MVREESLVSPKCPVALSELCPAGKCVLLTGVAAIGGHPPKDVSSSSALASAAPEPCKP
jgi:hypothetical protein